MKFLRTVLLATAALALPSIATAAEGVVVSIKPIHSLVAGVMQGVGTPHLIVKGAGSPHAYSLKPSDAEALEKARVVFWIGHEMENFLESSIESLATKAMVAGLEDTGGLVRLKVREGGTFDEHGHDDHADGDHKEDESGKHDDHDDDGDEDHKAEAKTEHEHGEINMHLWLDPVNARAMVREIAGVLSEADPANAATYKANATTLEGRLNALSAELSKTLAPVKDRPFVVFHDAYPYFENRFGIKAAGSITVSPEKLPGAKRLKEIQAKVKDLGATCVFSEPQFEPKLVKVVTEGTKAKAGVLDPLGADLKDGPDLYFTLLRNMAKSMKACLSPSS